MEVRDEFKPTDEQVIKMVRDAYSHVVEVAVIHGMSTDDAKIELDAYIRGNDTTYTARIRRILEVMKI